MGLDNQPLNLAELIEKLEEAPQDNTLRVGFFSPHSYRGSYSELAFEPAFNVTVAAMLKDARTALGSTYYGWKGGDFTMRDNTPVHWAQEGNTGCELTGDLLYVMLCGVLEERQINSPKRADLLRAKLREKEEQAAQAQAEEIMGTLAVGADVEPFVTCYVLTSPVDDRVRSLLEAEGFTVTDSAVTY